MTGARHVARLPGGGVALSPHMCAALLPLLDDDRRLGMLDPIGSTGASVIGLVGRGHAARCSAHGTNPASDRADDAPSTHADDLLLLDTADAAGVLGCSPRNVRKLAARGSLPGDRDRVAGRWTFRADVVAAYGRRRAG